MPHTAQGVGDENSRKQRGQLRTAREASIPSLRKFRCILGGGFSIPAV